MLKPIETDVTISLFVFQTADELICVKYECRDFPELVRDYRVIDVSDFKEFTSSKETFDFGYVTKEVSTIDTESLTRFEIHITKEYFASLNIVRYTSTIRKIVRNITGV